MIETELLRSCILEGLRRDPQTQYGMLEIATAGVANERGLPITGTHELHLHQEDLRRFRETVWALIIEGIIAIGKDAYNDMWPWMSLTEYGETVIQGAQVTPYDPVGYIDALSASAPLDAVEQRYLSQALAAFRTNLPDAAAVMLGAASEHLMMTVGERIEHSDPAEAVNARRALDGPALPLLRWLQAYFDLRRSRLDRHLRESLSVTFAGVASLIRNTRNDAGHPALSPVTREQVFVNLQLFIPYRAWVVEASAALPL
jgi:hypothetical protein